MKYDLIVIGAAPAGLSAALYASRSGHKVLVIDKKSPGGQTASTNIIDNYPGTPLGISGPEIVENMVEQAKKFGTEIIQGSIDKVELKGEDKKVIVADKTYISKGLVIATGASSRKLGVEGEAELTGKGISYCATCDAPFFEGLDVYVIGGGNSALDEAIYLTRFAKSVTIIHRKEEFSADKVTVKEAEENEKIKFIFNTKVVKFEGRGLLKSMTLENTKTGEISIVEPRDNDPIFGVFVFIGHIPATDLFAEELNLDGGYIITDEDMRTEIPMVYAAGDCRKKTLRQVVTAAADGAIAGFVFNKDLAD